MASPGDRLAVPVRGGGLPVSRRDTGLIRGSPFDRLLSSTCSSRLLDWMPIKSALMNFAKSIAATIAGIFLLSLFLIPVGIAALIWKWVFYGL